ncbi:zinc finger lsd1 subclass family protein (macronuclear) [Tetrahymena thermophila SB210]|uniref:Zinc finger lsd1 subclass family protein n=1 Tax=Tetrahymena thermophila (strain SB210) TaxID=312017 RepID=Q22M59_TETTS|nr:zinc finger lsd1 subclass family protein [Tetrahymena thermophila SB210]EAR86511.2 zinc finger lsd1 subclass family protein [Tetrahymena thermophila SB210]|eukprot:XP_977161.2 zinc finger lsd1 subclass family protein [Tetrahymena thermophila SB210]
MENKVITSYQLDIDLESNAFMIKIELDDALDNVQMVVVELDPYIQNQIIYNSLINKNQSHDFPTSFQFTLVQESLDCPKTPENYLKNQYQIQKKQQFRILNCYVSNCNDCQDNNSNKCKDCDEGYYLDNFKCSKCDKNCEDCQGSSTSCTKCKDSKVLDQQNQCVICDTKNGFFVSSKKICTACDSSCLTCDSSSKNCKSCRSDSTLQNNQCIRCDTENGYFLDSSKKCQKCDSSCKTCQGSKSNNCISCYQDKYLRDDKTCQTCDTNNGYYINSSGICKPCNNQCKSCNGDNSNNCLSCGTNLYLKIDGTCSQCTDTQYYQDKNQKKCLPCDPSCQTCSNSAKNSCLSCPANKFLYPDNTCNECQTQNGYYIDTKTNRCQPCFATCLTCIDGAENSCTSCKSSFLRMNPTDGSKFKCVQCNISSGQYANLSDCYNCHPTCKTCSDDKNTSCKTCVDGLYFFQQGTDKICQVCKTNNSQFLDSNQLCQNCNNNCLQCQGNANFCTACQSNMYLKQNTCVQCNEDGFYKSNNLCLQCHSSCKTCNGSNDNNCLSCTGSLNLNSQNMCVENCPDKTFPSNNVCQPCDPSCSTCKQLTKCETCPTGKYIFNDSLCQTCPVGYFGDDVSKSCKKCDKTCLTCDGLSQNNCLSCPPSIQLQDKSCPQPCPDKQVLLNKECKNCHASCEMCSDIDEFSCLKCVESYSFLTNKSGQKTCVECSSLDQYIQMGGDCLPCDPSCKTCKSPSDPNQCLSCLNGKFLKKDDNSCTQCIENGYYKNSSECLKCPSNCQKCSLQASTLKCEECISSLVRDEALTQCISCPTTSNSYYISDDKICKRCDTSCQTCSGELDTECETCFDGFNLLTLQDGKKKCIICGDGYFKDSLGNCKECIENCSVCDNESTCQVCKVNNSSPIYIDEKQQCLTSCDLNNGYFSYYDTVYKCEKCDANCQVCDNKTICKKCVKNTYLILQANGVDVKCDTCLQNNYVDNGDQFCKKCNPSCLTCDGPLTNNCLTCDIKNGLYKYSDGTCGNCSGNYRKDNLNCLKCDDKCNGCDLNGCTSCASGFYFDGNTKICNFCDIQDRKYINNGQCLKCNPKCQTCSGPNETDCLECFGDLTKNLKGECVKCDTNNGFYVDMDNKQCLPCAINCQQCTGPDISECTQCQQGLSLKINKAGQQICEKCDINEGYFIEGTKCSKCNSECLTCDGSQKNQCLTCFDGYYILDKDRSCVRCPNEDKFKLVDNCQDHKNNCEKDSVSGQYQLKAKCIRCKNGYLLQSELNACISDCKDLGNNLKFNNISQQCECAQSSDYFNIQQEIDLKQNQTKLIFCSKDMVDGYFCNKQKVCVQCNRNCKTCLDQSSCQICQKQFYSWQGRCIEKCGDGEGLQEDDSGPYPQCKCKPGYVIRIKEKTCVPILKIVSVQLSVQNDSNLLTIILNRDPFSDELEDLAILIDPKTMKVDQDYFIKDKKIVNNKIYFEISVNQNRKINEIQITLNKKVNLLKLLNTVLTTEEYNKNNKSSQERDESISNMSQTFVPEDPSTKNVMLVLKNFQILCILSNFIQVLGPIVILKESIPPQIFTYSLLGASFIFQDIPSNQELSYTIESQSENQEDKKDNSENKYSHQTKYLHQLGLKQNLYSNFIFAHLSLVISSVLIFLNLFARAIMKGKQYTILIVNTLLNVMSNLNQGYLTATIFSIYFSMQFQNSRGLAIFQAFIHLFFMILMAFVMFKKDNKYIELNIPNFLENINFQAKGSKSYILVSYMKKYFVIIIFLTTFSNPVMCSSIISAAFFLHGFYILFYRFFKYKVITYYKIFQEFFVGVTFIVLAVTCNNWINMMQKSIIENDELKKLEKLSFILFFMLIGCLALSLILFFIRFLISTFDFLKKIQQKLLQRKLKKQQEKKNGQLLLEVAQEKTINIWSLSNSNIKIHSYKVKQKQNQVQQQNSRSLTED